MGGKSFAKIYHNTIKITLLHHIANTCAKKEAIIQYFGVYYIKEGPFNKLQFCNFPALQHNPFNPNMQPTLGQVHSVKDPLGL